MTQVGRTMTIIKSVEMEVTATWGRGTIPAEDVSALRVGDTLVLETRIDEPAVVYVGDQPVFLGRPGAGTRGRYAVELMRSIPQEEASRYA